MSEASIKRIKETKAQAEKLERYINQYASRAVNVSNALGDRGCKMLSDLLAKVSLIDSDDNKIEITSVSQFMTDAQKRGYMTISKDYGVLAQGRDGSLKGKLLTEGPKGPIDKDNLKGWMEI